MKIIEIENKEKFSRAFQKNTEEATLFTRLGFGGEKKFCGKIREDRLLLYRKKIGILSLFALTLRGRFIQENGKISLAVRFSRSLPLSIFWALWCALLLAAGFSVLSTSLYFALGFLLPGFLFALPLFLYSGKEKERLCSFFGKERTKETS